MNRRLGQPAINIYKDNDTGKPKGVATLSYEEPICAKAAVEHFDGTKKHKLAPFHHWNFYWTIKDTHTHLFYFFFIGKEFQGQRIKVSMARRRPMMGGMRGGGGGMPMRDGLMPRGGKHSPTSRHVLKILAQPLLSHIIILHFIYPPLFKVRKETL